MISLHACLGRDSHWGCAVCNVGNRFVILTEILKQLKKNKVTLISIKLLCDLFMGL